MEAFRYNGRLPAAVAGVLGIALALSAMPASAAERTGGGDYILASPVLSINDRSQLEGNAGGAPMTFTVLMSKLSATDVKVNVNTADGTATTMNNDYVSVSKTLTIPAGSLSATVDVTILGDLINEQDETFQVNLTNPVGASFGDNQGIGTIQNDDLVSPCLTIKDVAVVEGESGKTLAVFTVFLDHATDQQVTVNYFTQGFVAGGTATEGVDYQANSGTLTFPPKVTSQSIGVNVNGDAVFEGDETFKVILFGLVNATFCFGDNQGVGTIIDDEVTATLLSQFAVESVVEGIALRWQFGEPSSIKSSWVERAIAQTGPWAKVEAEVLTEDGMLTMVDRSVEADHTYYYRLAAELTTGQMVRSGSIAATAGDIVREFALTRISPNPTNGPARIDYAVPQQSKVRLSVLDVQGRLVAVLVDGVVKAGRHQAVWSREMTRGTASAGMYFVRYEAGGKSFVKRVALTQ